MKEDEDGEEISSSNESQEKASSSSQRINRLKDFVRSRFVRIKSDQKILVSTSWHTFFVPDLYIFDLP